MINTIVIEDEKPSARYLAKLIEKENLNVIAVLNSVAQAKQWFLENDQPDLIFLDIQLSDGLSFEIFDDFDIKSAIIFTTAYDEYALKAFKLNSIDYLLKPIDANDLSKALQKYNSFKPNTELKSVFTEIQKLITKKTDKNYKQRFTIKIGNHIRILKTDEIECIFLEDKITHIFTVDGKTSLYNSSLESIEREINPQDFFRISRSVIINYHHIKDIISYANSRLKIVLNNFDKFDLIVSRERVNNFKAWIE